MIAERIGFLGGGKIAQAMAKGFISSGEGLINKFHFISNPLSPPLSGLSKGSNLFASCHPKDQISFDAFQSLGGKAFIENVPVVKNSDVVFLSVKPTVMTDVLHQVHSCSANKLFISIAMGVPLSTLQKNLDPSARVIRAMPNTPIMVQSGCSVFSRSDNASDEDASLAQTLFRSIGTCEEVPETYFDAITALSGSGPAYVYVLIEALADGGVKMGLPRDLSYRLAAQTVMGAGHMVRETKQHPAQLKDDVSSPGGSTIYALHHLEQSGFRASLIGAIERATNRCKEVAGEK